MGIKIAFAIIFFAVIQIMTIIELCLLKSIKSKEKEMEENEKILEQKNQQINKLHTEIQNKKNQFKKLQEGLENIKN